MMFRITRRSVATSRAEVASSNNNIGDFLRSALAIDKRCACPSEKSTTTLFYCTVYSIWKLLYKNPMHRQALMLRSIPHLMHLALPFSDFLLLSLKTLYFPAEHKKNSFLADALSKIFSSLFSSAHTHILPSFGQRSASIKRSIVVFLHLKDLQEQPLHAEMPALKHA